MGPEAAALAAILLAASADVPAGPWARWHFVFGAELEMSVLFRRDASGDETRLLVRCEDGRFELVSKQDPSGNDSTESLTAMERGERLERRILLKGKESVPGCEGVTRSDACLLWKGAGGEVSTGISEFSGEAAPAARRRVSALVSPEMRRRLGALAPLLTYAAEFGSFTDDFLRLVWPEWFPGRGTLQKGTRTRGCDFDAAFGHPCSEKERARDEARFSREDVRSPAGAPPTRTPQRPPRE